MDLKTLLNTAPWDWPEDAGDLLLETLVEKPANEADRLIAAELAGDITVMNDAMVNALLEILGDGNEPEDLRIQAVMSLGPILELGAQEGFEDSDDVPISERAFRSIRETLRTYFLDASASRELRRRILEASVRAPDDWHPGAISTAYSSGDNRWILSAVFAMGHVRGFDAQILESLQNPDTEIHYEAICAAGAWELMTAWPHVVALLNDPSTPKLLLLGAIEAAAYINPAGAVEILVDHALSTDEDIADTANEALGMAKALSGGGNDEDMTADGDWIN